MCVVHIEVVALGSWDAQIDSGIGTLLNSPAGLAVHRIWPSKVAFPWVHICVIPFKSGDKAVHVNPLPSRIFHLVRSMSKVQDVFLGGPWILIIRITFLILTQDILIVVIFFMIMLY